MFLRASLKRKGFPLDEAMETLRGIDRLPADTFPVWEERQRNTILLYHLNQTGWYREKIGQQASLEWKNIPILQKSDFQKDIKDMIAGNVQLEDVYVGNTSGSSGHPFFYAKDKFCHALTWAHVEQLYGQYDITLESKQARFYGIPLHFKGLWTEKTKDWLSNRVRFPVFDLSDKVLHKWLKRFQKTRFDYCYGYTSAMVYFARFCINNGVVLNRLCPSLKVCIVTSELCSPEDRAILEKGFGIPVVNEYGASELGIIAFERPSGDWKLTDELVYTEIVDAQGQPVPDETEGRILCTALFNKAMPIIRYDIGDIGIIQKQNGRRVLSKLSGRTNDLMYLPSGKVAAGLTFYYISRALLEEAGFINEFIIRQTQQDTLLFVIDAKRPVTNAEKAQIQAQMDRYLEPGLKLEIQEVDRIERPASGKIKHFYAEKSPPLPPHSGGSMV